MEPPSYMTHRYESRHGAGAAGRNLATGARRAASAESWRKQPKKGRPKTSMAG